MKIHFGKCIIFEKNKNLSSIHDSFGRMDFGLFTRNFWHALKYVRLEKLVRFNKFVEKVPLNRDRVFFWAENSYPHHQYWTERNEQTRSQQYPLCFDFVSMLPSMNISWILYSLKPFEWKAYNRMPNKTDSPDITHRRMNWTNRKPENWLIFLALYTPFNVLYDAAFQCQIRWISCYCATDWRVSFSVRLIPLSVIVTP